MSKADELFAIVERAAVEGRRCPTIDQLPYRTPLLADLARAGRIRIEVYSLNWRVVQITEGPNYGKRTAERPRGGEPYVIICKAFTKRHGRRTEPHVQR